MINLKLRSRPIFKKIILLGTVLSISLSCSQTPNHRTAAHQQYTTSISGYRASPNLKIPDWKTADKLLDGLDLQLSPFVVLSLSNHSYVQCLGSKSRLTVEARVYTAKGSFTHWVFGRGPLKGRRETIQASTGASNVDASQLLTISDARHIMRSFLETQSFPAEYHREDVTAAFLHPSKKPAKR